MYNLLNAAFFRLKKNKIFYFIILVSIGMALFFLYSRYADEMRYIEYNLPTSNLKSTDRLFADNVLVIGFLMSLFTSLFVGTEYSDGVIRNKIIAGHKRMNIYASNFIMSVIVGVIIEVIYLLIIASIGIPMFGGIEIPISEFLFILLDIFMMIVFYAAIFTFISLICSNITTSTVLCLLLLLAMLVVAALQIPGNELLNILPTGQGMQISLLGYKEEANIQLMWLYALGITVIINGIGGYLFNQKELK